MSGRHTSRNTRPGSDRGGRKRAEQAAEADAARRWREANAREAEAAGRRPDRFRTVKIALLVALVAVALGSALYLGYVAWLVLFGDPPTIGPI